MALRRRVSGTGSPVLRNAQEGLVGILTPVSRLVTYPIAVVFWAALLVGNLGSRGRRPRLPGTIAFLDESAAYLFASLLRCHDVVGKPSHSLIVSNAVKWRDVL
jgi:hypothetical protein